MAKVVLPRSLPRLLVHLFVRVFRGNDFFVHGQEKKEGWGEIYGSTCAPDSSQILAFQLSGGGGAVETKAQPLETLTFQPGRFIASDPLWSLPVAHRLP